MAYHPAWPELRDQTASDPGRLFDLKSAPISTAISTNAPCDELGINI
jgi:hypothetical protein